jgi:hypothetical protein
MVVAVVTPVVFVLGLLKNAIKALKLVVCKQLLYLSLYTVKHVKSHVTQIVVWPEPEPLWSNGTLAYWVRYRRKALVMARMINTLYLGLNVGIRLNR